MVYFLHKLFILIITWIRGFNNDLVTYLVSCEPENKQNKLLFQAFSSCFDKRYRMVAITRKLLIKNNKKK